MNNAPIGIFDSGVGGLTVARSIIDQLPHEELIYIADTARGPYGPRAIAEVRAFAIDIMDELVRRGVKMIVIACNTASAAVLRDAKSKPVAVLSHNKAAFYMVEPALFEAMLEELADQDLHRTVLSRMGERARAIEVDIDTI